MSMPPPLGRSNSTELSSSQPHPKPFKCGGCGVHYRTICGLQYHKENSSLSCKSPEKDEIPMEFKCGDCGKMWKTVGQYEQVFLTHFSFVKSHFLYLDEQEYINETLASV
jgi:hypothetical protein